MKLKLLWTVATSPLHSLCIPGALQIRTLHCLRTSLSHPCPPHLPFSLVEPPGPACLCSSVFFFVHRHFSIIGWSVFEMAKNMSHFSQNVWKYRIINSVTAGYLSKKMNKVSQQKNRKSLLVFQDASCGLPGIDRSTFPPLLTKRSNNDKSAETM